MYEKTTMGIRIREKRTENHMTMEELGNRVGVNKTAVSKWETGETKNMKQSTIKKLSEIFDCSPSWLMGLDDAYAVIDTIARPMDTRQLGEAVGEYARIFFEKYGKLNDDEKKQIDNLMDLLINSHN